jgi:toxin HigB-1
MIVIFTDEYLSNLYEGNELKGKPRYSQQIIRKFIARIDTLKNVENSNALYQFRSLNFEELKGDKKGTYSIRINDAYRLEFRIEKNVIALSEIVLVDKLSNHYG